LYSGVAASVSTADVMHHEREDEELAVADAIRRSAR
jgi:hypothetical protein